MTDDEPHADASAAASECAQSGATLDTEPVTSPDSFKATPGTHQLSLKSKGRTRTYRLYLPPNFCPGMAVMLAFHGGGGTGRAMESLTRMSETSDRNGFIVAYPDGTNRSWNAGTGAGKAEAAKVDDVAFVSALIDDLFRLARVDVTRVYATGISNGAHFVHRLACELPERIAAIAPVAGTIAPGVRQACHRLAPLPVIEIHGTADKLNPWEGGRTIGGGKVESLDATIAFWRKFNSCAKDAVSHDLGGGVFLDRYPNCTQGAEVLLYRIEGGGHTWPGGRKILPEHLVGPTNPYLDASQAIWNNMHKYNIDMSSGDPGARARS
jgi:polyhydroxybutyrate depolymerase